MQLTATVIYPLELSKITGQKIYEYHLKDIQKLVIFTISDEYVKLDVLISGNDKQYFHLSGEIKNIFGIFLLRVKTMDYYIHSLPFFSTLTKRSPTNVSLSQKMIRD
ncbi:MAG: hypothetical protein ABI045_05555 [Flavobacteriales bacterium]